jgi:hypothetical protein
MTGDDPFSDGHRVLSRMRCATDSPCFSSLREGAEEWPDPLQKFPRCPFYIGTRAAPINGLCLRILSAIENGFGPNSERGGRRAEKGACLLSAMRTVELHSH